MVERLRDVVKVILARDNIKFEHEEGDTTDVPIDFRLLGGLLKAAADPEVSIGSVARGVRVGPGSGMAQNFTRRRRSGGSQSKESKSM